MVLVYAEMRRLAQYFLAGERPGHTLQATALVHEAYERLVDQSRVDWRGRAHFFAAGAQAMRRLLVDYARRRGRLKRGGDRQRVTFREGVMADGSSELDLADLVALDCALIKLAEIDPRQAQCVELRFFAGMTAEETASALDISLRSVERDWTHARAWLARELANPA